MARVNFKETKAAQRFNSFSEFRANIKPSYNTGPSYNNLYGIQFGPPNVLQAAYQSRLVPGGNNNGNLDFLLNAYAQEVSSPSKNLTTATVNNIGSAWKYATGQSHSEISINFLMPRGARSYTFFERWMSHINNDATNYVDYFDDYTTDLIIYKMERGEGKREQVRQSDLIKEQQGDNKKKNIFVTLEEREDIEILRFVENGRKVLMYECDSGSISVDVPNDIEKIMEAFKS